MSVFPFITPRSRAEASATALPMFREYAYDYENNCLLLRDGNTYLVEGNEALRIWFSKPWQQRGFDIRPTMQPLAVRLTRYLASH